MYPLKSRYLKIFKTKDGAIIYNKRNKKSCKLGYREYEIFEKLDGKHTLESIQKQYDINKSELEMMLKLFGKYDLLKSDDDNKNIKGKLINGKLGLCYDDSYFDFFSNKFIKSILNVVSIISIPLLIMVIIFTRGMIDADTIISDVNILDMLVMDVILALSVSVHEIAHAIYAKNNGAFVGEIGIKFDFFVPSAYTTICGVEGIDYNVKKIQIFMCGITTNAMIAAVALFIMRYSIFNESLVVFMVFSVNICLVIFNCITCIKSDLYYALAYGLREIHLKEKSIGALKGKNEFNTNTYVYLIISYILQPIFILFLLFVAIKRALL